jgi:hypothetical protein
MTPGESDLTVEHELSTAAVPTELNRSLPQITASVPCLAPPAWATAERALLDLLDQGWRRFAELYTNPDGSIRYGGGISGRDGGDDFLETFFNWPQLYLLGGADDLLEASAGHWQGTVAQLTRLGVFRDEFEVGYDWFHQGEALLFFYFLTMAEPERWRARAVRFAELYVDPANGNYDAEHNIIRGPHNGAGGARPGVSDSSHYPWMAAEAAQYGYPLPWLVPEGAPVPPLDDDVRLGPELHSRVGQGDTVGNLAIVGLVLNAYLATGEQRFADWIVTYVRGWQERAEQNGGLIPDNVGLDGQVGSQLDGRWYGGHYGWAWPHGFYSIGQAVVVGATAATLVSGDERYLNMPRTLVDRLVGLGRRMRVIDSDTSNRGRWLAHLGPEANEESFVVPYRHADGGWFDWNPMQTSVPMALWHRTQSGADRERLEQLRAGSADGWRNVRPFRDKEEAGHEEPWYSYLSGDLPDYPARILDVAQTQARRRLALMEKYAGREVPEEAIHLWQDINPVVTEALTQLTWGAPQVVYNGGVAQARVRYYDAEARRPGLPPDVAALVSSIDPDATVVELVNLSGTEPRSLIVQAGALAEDDIASVGYETAAPDWAGSHSEYLPHPLERAGVTLLVEGPWLEVTLPASTEIKLTLALRRGVRRPLYRSPWADPTTQQ